MRERLFALALFVVAGCGPASKHDPTEDLMSIEVVPADQTLEYTGAPLSVDYQAIGHFKDGTTAPLDEAVFSLDDRAAVLGSLSEATFETMGQAGGKGGVLAQVGSVIGSTSVAVTVHPVHLGPGVPANGADNFPDSPPAGANAPTVVYPLEGAVMPSSVKAPDVQWEGANDAGDLYRVRLTAGEFATVDTILAAGPGFKLDDQLDAADWSMLVRSAGNGPITVQLAHWNQASSASAGTPVTMHMVEADVTGAIYYWNLGQGQMERIDAAGRAPAIPNPPMQPSTGTRCVACHTVSRDGRYLSGSLWGGGLQGAVFDMSDPAIQTADPAPTLAPVAEGSSYTQLFSTFNPDASRLLINVDTGLRLLDPHTGQTLPTNGTALPASASAHPAWSPDGTSVAYVSNISLGGGAASWAVDYDRGDLSIFSASANDTFGASTTLVSAASVPAQYAAPSWPTFSPDSSWIVFAAGVNSRGMTGTTPYPGALFLIDKNGGTAVRLDNLCGGQQLCYLPNFSPYDAGGYFWLVFYSVRDYGNALAGTKGKVQRQMWIAAIDKSKLATGGVDASAVAYWVPDQDVTTNNMSAFWSLPAPIQ